MSESRVLLSNEDVLAAYGTAVLWDSRLVRLEIQAILLEPVITLEFELIRREPSHIRIRFSGVHEFAFNHDSSGTFYFVERVKFIPSPRGFYLSLDPASEDQVIEETDNDIIHCTTIELLEITATA